MDRIAEDTEFNKEIFPLKGTEIVIGGTNNANLAPYAQIREFEVVNIWNKDIKWDGVVYHANEVIKGNYLLYDSDLDSRIGNYGVFGATFGHHYFAATNPILSNPNDIEAVDFFVVRWVANGTASGYSIVSWETDSNNNVIFTTYNGARMYWGQILLLAHI